MSQKPSQKCAEFIFPEERVIDCLKFTSFYRPCEFVLTDQRLLVAGYTGALGPHLTLQRGTMVAGMPLEKFDSFIVGTGKRPMLFFIFMALATAGGLMVAFPMARYPGLVVIGCAVVALLAWTAWPRTFISIGSDGIKISGRARLCEAVVFLEKLQLAARAARLGASPEQIREAASATGKTVADAEHDDRELTAEDVDICEPEKPKDRQAADSA